MNTVADDPFIRYELIEFQNKSVPVTSSPKNKLAIP